MNRLFFVSFTLGALLFLVSNASASCTFKDKTGSYNLAALEASTDYTIQVNNNNPPYTIYVNVCKKISTACNIADPIACQKWEGGESSLGNVATQTFHSTTLPGVDGQGVSVTYTGGQGVSGDAQKITINFQCDKTIDIGTPVVDPSSGAGNWVLDWKTKHGCSTGAAGGLSVGSILLIVLVCVVPAYFVGGILFNKFARHASGMEVVPNIAFWSALPGLVKDGAMFAFNKITRRGGYSQV